MILFSDFRILAFLFLLALLAFRSSHYWCDCDHYTITIFSNLISVWMRFPSKSDYVCSLYLLLRFYGMTLTAKPRWIAASSSISSNINGIPASWSSTHQKPCLASGTSLGYWLTFSWYLLVMVFVRQWWGSIFLVASLALVLASLPWHGADVCGRRRRGCLAVKVIEPYNFWFGVWSCFDRSGIWFSPEG